MTRKKKHTFQKWIGKITEVNVLFEWEQSPHWGGGCFAEKVFFLFFMRTFKDTINLSVRVIWNCSDSFRATYMLNEHVWLNSLSEFLREMMPWGIIYVTKLLEYPAKEVSYVRYMTKLMKYKMYNVELWMKSL